MPGFNFKVLPVSGYERRLDRFERIAFNLTDSFRGDAILSSEFMQGRFGFIQPATSYDRLAAVIEILQCLAEHMRIFLFGVLRLE